MRDIRLYRDIYYLDPARAGWKWTAKEPLGQREFLLLGDNAPISVDSRHWQPQGINSKYLLGRVLRHNQR